MNKHYLLAALLLMQSVCAQDQHRQHAAHVHGHAMLNLVVSGQQLLLELETPANNLLGFEHQAKSEQDKKILQHALAVLNDPLQWLQPDAAASCQLQSIDIDSGLLQADHDSEHGHEEHEKHAAYDEHDKHKAEGHQVHAEFEISLSYTCAKPARLKSVDAGGLFQRFSNMQEIEVQWITDRKQSATELSRDKGIIWLQ